MIKSIVVSGAFSLCSFLCHAQQGGANELLLAIQNAKSSGQKADALNAYGQYWFDKNYDSAVYYYEKAFAISNAAKYKKGIFDYASNMGNVYMFGGKYKELEKLMLASVDRAREFKDKHYEAIFIANLGNAFMYNAEYEKALAYFQKGVQLFNENREFNYERKINIFISICFFNSENLDKAIEYAKLSAVQSEKASDSVTHCKALGMIGKCYVEKNDFQTAKPFLEQSLNLSERLNMQVETADNQANLGRVFHSEKDYAKAISYSENALKYFTESGNEFYRINTLTFLSTYYKDSKNNSKAIDYLKKAEQLAEKKNMKSHLLLVYAGMATLNRDMEHYKEAYSYLEKQKVLSDSLSSANLKSKLQELDVKFQNAEKTRQILVLEKEQDRQKLVIFSLSGIVLVLVLLAYLMYRNYAAKKRINEQKIQQLETQQQLTATEAVLKGEEQERSRLAKDLHDGLGGMLSGIKYSFANMKGNLIMTPDNVHAFDRGMDMLDSSIQEMRRVAHNLMPEALVKFGLDIALKDFCNDINHTGALQVSYQSFGLDEPAIPQTTAIAVYRIVQELINNTIKHSGATHAIVQLSKTGGTITLTVEDDGKGFDPDVLNTSKGIGWENIRHRVNFLKGKLDVNTEPGKGTSVLIELSA